MFRDTRTGNDVIDVDGDAVSSPGHHANMYYTFSKPPRAACGMYDLVLHVNGKLRYFAVFTDGFVGFTTVSSNGQSSFGKDGDFVTT